ncbi:MAG TPA: hypothetical protein VNH11_19360 [Pirellulales bacterium]|nr:hypothetical protein [Pirellulales bacterium]
MQLKIDPRKCCGQLRCELGKTLRELIYIRALAPTLPDAILLGEQVERRVLCVADSRQQNQIIFSPAAQRLTRHSVFRADRLASPAVFQVDADQFVQELGAARAGDRVGIGKGANVRNLARLPRRFKRRDRGIETIVIADAGRFRLRPVK